MADNKTTKVPFEKSGDKQGMKYCASDVLDVNGTTVKTGDIMRTRLTGGLGHATLHSKTPSSGHKFRDDQGGKGKNGAGTSKKDQHWA